MLSIAPVLIAIGGATPLAAQVATDLYERGVGLRSRGSWREALELWATAPDSLMQSGQSDPRIGVAFMETAIHQDAFDQLTEASRLYLWGFSGTDMAAYADEVGIEATRILPLLSRRDSARWSPLLAGPPERLARAIARFWLERDPTPETQLNERLIEHWERIVEARRIYAYNRSSVYETDDRGVIYVKYGPPDTRTRGNLGSSEMELKIRIPDDPLAREAIRRLDPNPQFELWKYGGLNPEEFSYFLFGNVRGTGPFELVESPLDLIGDAARSLTSARLTPGGVKVQYYFELFYYRDLAVLGGRYGRRFDELAQLWDWYTERRTLYGGALQASPTRATLESFSYRFAEEDRYAPEGVPTVSVRSEFEGDARAVEMVVQPVRILDESNQPMIVIQALSAPRVRLHGEGDWAAHSVPSGDVKHTLILRDEVLADAGHLSRPAASGGVSVFWLRHPPRPLLITVVGRTAESQRIQGDAPVFPGQAHAFIEAPLSSDPSRLEVSDLAVGTAITVEASYATLPFPLLPTERLWTGDELRLYLELYHLTRDLNGLARYDLTFRLLPLDDVGEVRPSAKAVTLGIQLEAEGPTAREYFDIGLVDFEPGFYRLEVDATDLVAHTMRTRSAEIEIIG